MAENAQERLGEIPRTKEERIEMATKCLGYGFGHKDRPLWWRRSERWTTMRKTTERIRKIGSILQRVGWTFGIAMWKKLIGGRTVVSMNMLRLHVGSRRRSNALQCPNENESLAFGERTVRWRLQGEGVNPELMWGRFNPASTSLPTTTTLSCSLTRPTGTRPFLEQPSYDQQKQHCHQASCHCSKHCPSCRPKPQIGQ